MTQEEKAKAHDEALKVIKKCVPDENGFITIYPQEIFPELNEDEDDKIKQRIIKLIKMSSEVGGFALHKWEADEMLTWLERQGKEEYALKSFKDEDVRKFMQCIKKQAKAYEFNLPNRGYDIYAFAKDLLVWLEKQGEQKPAVEMKSAEESLNISSEEYNKIVDECLYSDNVEPKFKVGQWIVWQDKCYKINYNGCGYELIDQNGLSTSLEYGTVDENAHIWTIQDAKDGDVLCVKYGNDELPFIFTGKQDNVAYCALNSFGEFVLSIAEWLLKTSVLPATKEQRNKLEKAMADAGYTFDFESKELKKIKQNHVWSEEDDKIIEEIINDIECARAINYHAPKEGYEFRENWLKSLKNKVQPTQVWSVEDKLMLMSCIEIMQTVDSTEEQQNWLKSLRPQNHWKPSEEQIKALYDAVFEANWETMDIDSLESLYNDLKKL